MSSNSDRVTAFLKQAVLRRANNYCEYCRSPGEYSPDSFTVDHIKPRKDGGKTTEDNLAWSCFGCNSRKHTKTFHRDPETDREVALFNPRTQVWLEHFGSL